MKELWTEITNSTYKLFFVKRQEPGKRLADWHLLQVNLDETDPQKAKRLGENHARYYIQQYKNAKKRGVMECRFRPLKN
jgi:hypothetical protein